MADTMLTFSRNLSSTFLTEDELKKICPMAFKTEPTNPDVSDKYTMATTMDVVNDMAQIGWFPTQAKQCRGKKNSKGIRSYHMISFQNPDIKILKDGEIEAYPTIILQNSHDGFSSFKFMCGLYRLVCSNGLILADAEYASVSIRHINYNFEELRHVINDIVEKLPEKIAVINKMKSTELTEEQKTEFATNVIKVRKDIPIEKEIEVSNDTITDILTPVRKEDEGNNLWAIYNVLQEKIINGYFSYAKDENTKARKMRKITSPIKDININCELFKLASNYMNVAA